MAFGNSIGDQGLFGSQIRPGMRATALPVLKGRKRRNLGSLSGSSLGDDTPNTATMTGGDFLDIANSGTVQNIATSSATLAAQAAAAQRAATIKRYALYGGVGLALLLLLRRRGGSSPAAVPTASPVKAVP